jgi:hypothetical protein
MEKGTYTRRRVDFSRYTASCFNPYLFSGAFQGQMGCGACALALLTGVPPEVIAAKHNNIHYADSFMVRFLQQHGFRLLQLTLCNVSSATPSQNPTQARRARVAALPQKRGYLGCDASRHRCFHNFETYTVDSLSLLNKPILSAYLVTHLRWRLGVRNGKVPKLKFARSRRLAWAQLRGNRKMASHPAGAG